MTQKHKVSKEAQKWASDQIESGVLNSPPALNSDGSPKTLRQLLAEAKERYDCAIARCQEAAGAEMSELAEAKERLLK